MSGGANHFLDFGADLCLRAKVSGWINLVAGFWLLRENRAVWMVEERGGEILWDSEVKKDRGLVGSQTPVCGLGSSWLLQNHLRDFLKTEISETYPNKF